MPSYKWDFNSCAIRDSFYKSSHICRVVEFSFDRVDVHVQV